MAETIKPAEPIYPFDPTDPSNCPTCFSGIQPVDPPYAVAIDAEY